MSSPIAEHNHPRVGRASRQRRWTVLAVVLGCMLLLAALVSFSPAASAIYSFVLTDHIGALCLLALSEVMSPLHKVFELAVLAGILIAAFDRLRTWSEVRALMSAVNGAPAIAGSALARAANEAQVPLDRVYRIADSPVPAFTIGALHPRIYVSDRIDTVLSHDELVAVLAHEGEHLRRRDPLRLSAMRFLAKALYWLPAFRSLEAQMAEETELRADAAAAKRSGVVTAAALLSLVRHYGRVSAPGGAAGLSQHEFISLRVRLLTGQDARTQTKVSRAAIAMTCAVVTLLWMAALAELHKSTHTRHLVNTDAECVEHELHPVRHMFCSDTPGERIELARKQ